MFLIPSSSKILDSTVSLAKYMFNLLWDGTQTKIASQVAARLPKLKVKIYENLKK